MGDSVGWGAPVGDTGRGAGLWGKEMSAIFEDSMRHSGKDVQNLETSILVTWWIKYSEKTFLAQNNQI